VAEEAGIEPAKAFSAHIGFEDREGHQTPSTSTKTAILWHFFVTGNAFLAIKTRYPTISSRISTSVVLYQKRRN
jgi:hypothetical protein